MKIKVNGDIVTIVSDINYEALKNATKKNPLMIKEEGKTVYGVEVAQVASINNVGVSFTFASEGKAALNIAMPETLMMPQAEAKEFVLDALTDTLHALSIYTDCINTALAEINDIRTEIGNNIEF